MSTDYDDPRDAWIHFNRAGRRAAVASQRKRKGSNFTRSKKRR